MKKKVLIDDIASKLGVSRTLVSFVLNDKGDQYGISASTQEKVRQLAQELNYQPNQFAKSLRTGRSYTVGLIIPDISNSFYSCIAKHIEQLALKHGYHVIFSCSEENIEQERELVHILINRYRIDGLIIASCEKDSSAFESLLEQDFPLVSIDRDLYNPAIPQVMVDNFDGAYKATNLLIDKGYKLPVMLQVAPNYLSSIKERSRGFENACVQAGIKDYQIIDIPLEQVEDSTCHLLKTMFDYNVKPDCFFASNNFLATCCISYFKNNPRHTPKDIGLVSFDDIKLFTLSSPTITAVAQPIDDIGEKAIEILIKTIESKEKPQLAEKIILPVELIERESTRRIGALADQGR